MAKEDVPIKKDDFIRCDTCQAIILRRTFKDLAIIFHRDIYKGKSKTFPRGGMWIQMSCPKCRAIHHVTARKEGEEHEEERKEQW